ncbi:MAG TPA: glycosyltransferase [bacterium]|nr:glycosyltransferase [bacterium]
MRKRILIVTCELLPVPGQPVRGGGLRVWGLGEGLRAHGHEVMYALPKASVTDDVKLPDALKHYLYVPEGLNELILEVMPDLLIVEQWGVATFIDDLKIPLIIDLHGPLSLENAFKQSANFLSDALTKIEALGKADLLVCPGQYQRNYFLTWFLMAGADPLHAPIEVVPVSLDKNLPAHEWPAAPRFVFGGVTWPWIDPFPGLEMLAERVAKEKDASLELFVGAPKQRFDHALDTINVGIFRDYRERLKDYANTRVRELIPRDELLAAYARASVAYDLYQPNSERQLAFTTRTIEYLWCGLPVVYGDYGELAKPIRDYDAGWVVAPDDEKAVAAALDEIFGDPQAVRRKGENAQRLAREQYTWEQAIKPLLAFVANPVLRDKKSSVLSGFRNYFRKESLVLINQAKDEIEKLNRELRQAIARGDQERRERDKKIDELSEEIKDLTRQNDQELRKQAEQNRRELEGKENDLRRMQEKIDYEIKARDEEIKRLHTERQLAEQKALEEIKRLTQDREKLRETLSADLKSVTEKKDEELKELKREREKERDRLQARVDQLVAESEEEKKKSSDEIKTLNREKEQLRETLSAQMKAAVEKKDDEQRLAKEESVKERDRLQARVDQLIAELEDEKKKTSDEIKTLNREKEQLRETLSAETRHAVEKKDEEFKDLKKEQQTERDKLQTRIDELTRLLDEEKKSASEEIKTLNREKETTRREHEEQVRLLVEKHEREQEKATAKAETATKEQQTNYQRELDTRAAAERELNQELRLLKQKLETAQTSHQGVLDKLREKHEAALKEAQTETRTQLAKRDERIETLAAAADEAREKLREVQSGQDDKLAAMAAQVDEAREEMRKQVAQRDEELVEARRALADETEKSESQLAQMRDLLSQRQTALADQERDKEKLAAELARLENQIGDKLAALEALIGEKEQYIAQAERRLGEMADKTAKQAQRNTHLERQLQQAQIDLGRTTQALGDRVAQADMLLGDLDKMRPALRDLEGEVDSLRKQTSLQQRLLADFETDENLKAKRRRGRRSYRWLVQLPRLAYLFTVNLATNAYIEKWQHRTGKKIFPGT